MTESNRCAWYLLLVSKRSFMTALDISVETGIPLEIVRKDLRKMVREFSIKRTCDKGSARMYFAP